MLSQENICEIDLLFNKTQPALQKLHKLESKLHHFFTAYQIDAMVWLG